MIRRGLTPWVFLPTGSSYGIGRGWTLNDERTSEQSRRGIVAPESMRVAIEQHAAAMYRLAISILRDPALADDAVQETMIKAWRHAPLQPDGSVPRAWMLRVVRNTAISMLRSRRDALYGDDTPEQVSGITVARAVEGRAALGELSRALDRLDPESRAVIVLREIDGLSYEDIASTMDLPMSTVKTRLFRARQVLKRALEDWQ